MSNVVNEKEKAYFIDWIGPKGLIEMQRFQFKKDFLLARKAVKKVMASRYPDVTKRKVVVSDKSSIRFIKKFVVGNKK